MPMQEKIDYRIYPSLMIKYQDLLDYEKIADEDWNKVSEAAHARGEFLDKDVGDYKLTPEEMYVRLETELLDSINRVEVEYSEAASKGTAFNEIVDCLIEHRKSSREDCKIRSCVNSSGVKVIRAEIDGMTFDYDIALCKKVAAEFPQSIPQYFVKATMPISFGNVELYGYLDEWVGAEITDIKTTSRYSWGKFEKGWQRHVYPWCVIEMGVATEIDSFTYYVVEWAYQRKGEPLKAKEIYKETYSYDHHTSGGKIREHLESLVAWIESRRQFIQSKKIFGGEDPEGWSGRPIDRDELFRFLFPDEKTA